MTIKLHNINVRKEQSSVLLPDGTPYYVGQFSGLMLDDSGRVYMPVSSSSVEDFEIHKSKFVELDCGVMSNDFYADVEKYCHLIRPKNLRAILGDFHFIKSLSDLDLALHFESQEACKCILTRKSTKWSEEWLKLPNGLQVRSHMFYSAEEKKNVLEMLDESDLQEGCSVMVHTLGINRVQGEMALLAPGLTKVKLSMTDNPENVRSRLEKKHFQVIEKTITVTDGSISFVDLVHTEVQSKVNVENGTYTVFFTDASDLSSPFSNVVLCRKK